MSGGESGGKGHKLLIGWEFLGSVLLATLVIPFLAYKALEIAMFDDRPPIIAFERAEAVNSPVPSGGVLRVKVHRKKARKDCTVTPIRSAMDDDGRVFMLKEAFDLPGGATDSDHVIVDYDIPAELPDGDYSLRVHLIYNCPGDLTFHYDQPPVSFRVISDSMGAK